MGVRWASALATFLFCAMVSRAHGSGLVTLVTTSSGHEKGLLNWLGSVDNAHEGILDTIVVLSMDEPVHKLMTGHGARSVLGTAPHEARQLRTRDQIWLTRMKLVLKLLTDGTDVLMSDVDALWLRDPLPAVRMQLASGADIVASRATKWPQVQAEKWGTVLCMGFVYFRATTAVTELMSGVVQAMEHAQRPDDQVAINEVLDAMGLRWNHATGGVVTSTAATTGKTSSGMAVSLLSAESVYRSSGSEAALSLSGAVESPNILVYHAPDFVRVPLSPSNQTLPLWVPRKSFDSFDEKQLRDANVWTLRDDWQSSPFPKGAVGNESTHGRFAEWIRDVNGCVRI